MMGSDMNENELLACRKCGELNYDLWDGRGTQAEMYCNNCGQSESVQICDLFEIGDKRRHADFIDENYTNRPDIVEIVNEHLFTEWNTRADEAKVKELEELRDGFMACIEKRNHELNEAREDNERYKAAILAAPCPNNKTQACFITNDMPVQCDCWKREALHHKEDKQCEHGKDLSDYCEPCGRIHGGPA